MRVLNATIGKYITASVIACGMLLVLTGCQIPTLALPEPGPALPSDFNGLASPENSAQLTIEQFFNDPALTQTIGQALASNQELRIINQEIQIASNEILARKGATASAHK